MKHYIFGLLVLILVFGLLESRLAWLTIVKGSEYEISSRENRIKVLTEPAARGIITDHKGEVLVRNVPEGRKYLFREKTSHLMGYLGEADQSDLESDPELRAGDQTGQSGLEQQYDQQLRGKKAERLVEVDAVGKVIREMGFKPAQAGTDLRLNLDIGLQEQAFKALGDKTGAVIASRPDGSVLALVSKPSFDPNLFTLDNGQADGASDQQEPINQLLTNDSQPLFDRAISGLYPPGSTFKPVTAIAGLESGKITGDTVFEDVGNLCIGQWCFGNWYYLQYGRKEGMVDMVKALQRSNDIYFYQVGQELGIKAIADWAKNFGFNQPTGIDLPGEESGLMPDMDWKERVKKESWYLGDTLISSIGQGDILATPIQVHHLISTLANNGLSCPPRLLAATKSPTDEQWQLVKPPDCRDLGIQKEYLSLVRSGMTKACQPGGTGWPFFNFGLGEATVSADFKPISTACKTGTAELGDPKKQTHAWFSVMAPADTPEIVVTVLVEKGGEGSSVAAPIAKEVLKYYFSQQDI
jgi:penicillin-binding protein 2